MKIQFEKKKKNKFKNSKILKIENSKKWKNKNLKRYNKNWNIQKVPQKMNSKFKIL